MIVVLKTKTTCKEVLGVLRSQIKRYGQVTVADVKNATSQEVTYTDYKRGWLDLDDAGITKTKNGWFLILPEAKDL